MNSLLNPLKNHWFYIGNALGLYILAGKPINEFVLGMLIHFPNFFVIAALFLLVALHATSIWGSQKFREYAEADKRNFGLQIANFLAGSGHSFFGLGFVGLIHSVFTQTAGSNLQLFLLCFFCGTIPFYWFADFIQQCIQKNHAYSL